MPDPDSAGFMIGVAALFGGAAAAVALWFFADVALFIAGVVMAPAGLAVAILAGAVFQQIVGVELLVGGLLLVGISALIRTVKGRAAGDSSP